MAGPHKKKSGEFFLVGRSEKFFCDGGTANGRTGAKSGEVEGGEQRGEGGHWADDEGQWGTADGEKFLLRFSTAPTRT